MVRIEEIVKYYMGCKQVKKYGGDYYAPSESELKGFKDSGVLSHGYCPPCGEKWMASLKEDFNSL